MARPLAITALPVAPEVDRHHRFVAYSVMMAIRIVCIVAAFLIDEWWRVLLVLAALVLPYVAVVIANVSTAQPATEPEHPGPAELPGRREE